MPTGPSAIGREPIRPGENAADINRPDIDPIHPLAFKTACICWQSAKPKCPGVSGGKEKDSSGGVLQALIAWQTPFQWVSRLSRHAHHQLAGSRLLASRNH